MSNLQQVFHSEFCLLKLNRYINRSSDEVLGDLSELLNIPNLGSEDSDLIFAVASRVKEFCDIYEQNPQSNDEKYALMGLIISSYDNYLNETNISDDSKHRIFGILEKDFDLHKDTIEYWGRINPYDSEKMWAVSPLMRELLDRHHT